MPGGSERKRRRIGRRRKRGRKNVGAGRRVGDDDLSANIAHIAQPRNPDEYGLENGNGTAGN